MHLKIPRASNLKPDCGVSTRFSFGKYISPMAFWYQAHPEKMLIIQVLIPDLIYPFFTARKRIVVWNFHATWWHLKTTIFTSVVYGVTIQNGWCNLSWEFGNHWLSFQSLSSTRSVFLELDCDWSKILGLSRKIRRLEGTAMLHVLTWIVPYFLTNPRQLKYNMELIGQYRKALDKAVLIATKQNVPPIPGKTLIFINGNRSMNQECQQAKGLGSFRTVRLKFKNHNLKENFCFCQCRTRSQSVHFFSYRYFRCSTWGCCLVSWRCTFVRTLSCLCLAAKGSPLSWSWSLGPCWRTWNEWRTSVFLRYCYTCITHRLWSYPHLPTFFVESITSNILENQGSRIRFLVMMARSPSLSISLRVFCRWDLAGKQESGSSPKRWRQICWASVKTYTFSSLINSPSIARPIGSKDILNLSYAWCFKFLIQNRWTRSSSFPTGISCPRQWKTSSRVTGRSSTPTSCTLG